MTNNIISILCNTISKIPKDKLLHYIAGYVIFDCCFTFIYNFDISNILNILTSFLITTAFILGKEIIDEELYNGFDIYDIIASYIGVITKVILLIMFMI